MPTQIDSPVIVAALRTAISRASKRGGVGKFFKLKSSAFINVPSEELSSRVILELLAHLKLKPEDVELIEWGSVAALGKNAFPELRAKKKAFYGLDVPPEKLPAAVNNQMACGSALAAINHARQHIIADGGIVIAGGVEHMDHTPMGANVVLPNIGVKGDFVTPISNFLTNVRQRENITEIVFDESFGYISMGESADRIAEAYGIEAESMYKFSAQSHAHAHNAIERGLFKSQIVPIPVKGKRITKDVLADDGIIKNTSSGKIAKLPSSFGGSTNAGTSSFPATGAAGVLMTSEYIAKNKGLKVLAKPIACVIVSSNSELQLDGPIFAIRKLLDKTNLKINDVDLFEINEAFASVVLATIQECNIDPKKVNVNGGAIAMGHPLGASGAIITVKLLHEMERKTLQGEKARYGVAVLCAAGGQAIAMLFEKS